jgi:hypothetical protein
MKKEKTSRNGERSAHLSGTEQDLLYKLRILPKSKLL